MIEKLNQILQGLIERVKDSGWQKVNCGSNFSDYQSGIRCRKNGNIVQISAHVRNTAAYNTTTAAANRLICTLPEEFRPGGLVAGDYLAPGTGYAFLSQENSTTFLVGVYENGAVYVTLDGSRTIGAGTAHVIDFCFLAGE